MRPRVFVSSVMDGFSEYRASARAAIETAGGEAVLVEDFPSLPVSSRTACLDGVASCDALLIIIGERGGWPAPSGKLVVEEEFDEARRRNKPVTLLIQDVSRDADGQALERKLSDYVDGLFRKTFSSADELNRKVQAAIAPLLSHLQEPIIDSSIVMERVRERKDRYQQENETNLRFVLSPEREDDFIDLVVIDSRELKNEIFELGTTQSVQLLSHERPKKATVRDDTLVIEQNSRDINQSREAVDDVLLEINYRGIIVIDVNVTGRTAADWRGFSHSIILEEDIVAGLQRCTTFVSALYQKFDPYKRYNRFHFNTALSNLNHRTLRTEPVVGNSMTVQMHNSDVVVAYDAPRLLSRNQLESSEEEIQRAMTMLRRRLQAPH